MIHERNDFGNRRSLGFGRVNLGAASAEDNGNSFPEMYQTTFDLTALGLGNQPIVSIGFTDPSTSTNESTAIFALSGTAVPEPTTVGLLGAAALLLVSRRKR